uniref:Uncharacterized protein n=1 Tax=Anopheles culicifacies TaxID=139723 RepID=A0A182M993_9DIPT
MDGLALNRQKLPTLQTSSGVRRKAELRLVECDPRPATIHRDEAFPSKLPLIAASSKDDRLSEFGSSEWQSAQRLTVAVLMVVVLLVAGIRATPQDDTAKANRNSLLLRRGNVGRPLGRTTPTTTTTTTPSSADYAEDEYADSYDEGKGEDGEDGAEEGPAGGKQATTTTTTTEAPKKIRPSIRPFRSNDDLLTALKKRRQESKNNKPAAAAPKEKVYDDEDVPAPAVPAKSAKAPAIEFLTKKKTDDIVLQQDVLPLEDASEASREIGTAAEDAGSSAGGVDDSWMNGSEGIRPPAGPAEATGHGPPPAWLPLPAVTAHRASSDSCVR